MSVENKVIVELKNIRKEFPGVLALDQVNMKIREGHVHALVGENGAGKSTLMKILSGTYQNYGGQVLLNGNEVHLRSQKDAFENGISIVAQELNYVPELTIAENLYLGREPKRSMLGAQTAAITKITRAASLPTRTSFFWSAFLSALA